MQRKALLNDQQRSWIELAVEQGEADAAGTRKCRQRMAQPWRRITTTPAPASSNRVSSNPN